MRFPGMLSILLLLSTLGTAQTPDGLELFDSALGQVGMTREDVPFDADELEIFQGHPWQLSSFSLFHNNPFKLPQHSRLTLDLLTTEVNSITLLTARASRLIDHPIRRSLIGDPLEPYLVYPDSIPHPSIMRSKNVLPGEQFSRLKDGIDLIYRMADDNEFLFRKGLKEADKNKFRERLFDFFVNDNDKYQDLVYELVEKVDFNYFLAGAQDFADAAHRFAEAADSLVFPEAKREIKTGKGLIVIGSTGDDVFEYFVPPLMIIDGGGNDTYKFGGYPDGYPLTVIIDFAGDDRYFSPDSTLPGIGGAVLGMSILIDREGNDRYEGVNVTQGAGIFAVGLLQDGAGDDVYTASEWSQAAATFGLGILSDRSGADSLSCLSYSPAGRS